MSRENLSLQTLHQLSGGRAGVAVNSVLNQALSDVEDRGDDEQRRVVTIKVTIKKLKGTSDVVVHVSPGLKLPTLEAGGTVCRLASHGPGRAAASFEPDSPANPDQRPIWDSTTHPEAPEGDGEGD